MLDMRMRDLLIYMQGKVDATGINHYFRVIKLGRFEATLEIYILDDNKKLKVTERVTVEI